MENDMGKDHMVLAGKVIGHDTIEATGGEIAMGTVVAIRSDRWRKGTKLNRDTGRPLYLTDDHPSNDAWWIRLARWAKSVAWRAYNANR